MSILPPLVGLLLLVGGIGFIRYGLKLMATPPDTDNRN